MTRDRESDNSRFLKIRKKVYPPSINEPFIRRLLITAIIKMTTTEKAEDHVNNNYKLYNKTYVSLVSFWKISKIIIFVLRIEKNIQHTWVFISSVFLDDRGRTVDDLDFTSFWAWDIDECVCVCVCVEFSIIINSNLTNNNFVFLNSFSATSSDGISCKKKFCLFRHLNFICDCIVYMLFLNNE